MILIIKLKSDIVPRVVPKSDLFIVLHQLFFLLFSAVQLVLSRLHAGLELFDFGILLKITSELGFISCSRHI